MKKRNISNVLVLLVFAVFMVSVLLVLLSGADAVKELTARDRRSYQHRTAVQYISTRVRQADVRGAVSTELSDGVSTLVLAQDIDGSPYETRIYCYDGYLREMFCESGAGIPPEFGEEIIPMDAFSADLEGNALRIVLSMPDGTDGELFVMLRSEGGTAS